MSDFDAGFLWGVITGIFGTLSQVGFYMWARYRPDKRAGQPRTVTTRPAPDPRLRLPDAIVTGRRDDPRVTYAANRVIGPDE